MTKEQLQALISTGENEQLEFKETTGQRGDACQALCAFLNADGGTVVFGVSRKGILTGQLVSDSTKRDLFEVFAKFEPSVAVATDDKMSKISNIIAVMRRNGEIENAGTDRKPIWKLTKTSGHEGRKSV